MTARKQQSHRRYRGMLCAAVPSLSAIDCTGSPP